MVSTGVFPVPPPRGGGAENHVYYLTNALAEQGHNVHLVSDIIRSARFHENVMIYPINAPPASFRAGFVGWMRNHLLGGISVAKALILRLLRFINSFDIVHVHGRLSPVATWLIVRKLLNLKKALVYTAHDLSPWEWVPRSSIELVIRKMTYLCAELWACQMADHIITPSSDIKRELMGWGVPQSKITVIPNGVDISLFSPRRNPQSSSDHNYCLFVGQLVHRKGVKYLLYALRKVQSDLRCLIVGDGPLLSELRSLAKRLCLDDKVRFLGSVTIPRLVELYRNALFLVLPSLVEPFGIVILEALACGTPVIATRVGGPSEIIKHGVNGFLVKPADVDELAKYMSILAENDELRKAMRRNARHTAEKNYDWRLIAKKTLSVYKHVINAKTP